MSEVKRYSLEHGPDHVSSLKPDKNGKYVEYLSLAAKDAEIERLQKEIKQILTLGVEMQREVNRKLSLLLDDLKSELVEKDAALEFYALPENWINYQSETWSRACPKSHGDEEMIRNYAHKNRDWNGTIVVGGKRAREVMAKYKKGSV